MNDADSMSGMPALQNYVTNTGSSAAAMSTQQSDLYQMPLPEGQTERICEAAEELCKSLPAFEPKFPTGKKKTSRELEVYINS